MSIPLQTVVYVGVYMCVHVTCTCISMPIWYNNPWRYTVLHAISNVCMLVYCELIHLAYQLAPICVV